jgi:hypothetical protein
MVLLAWSSSWGCSDDEATDGTMGGMDMTPTDMSASDGGTMDMGPPALSFATDIYEDIIAVQCAPCHTAGGSGALRMPDADTAFMNLVGVDAAGTQCGGPASFRIRVIPNDSAGSLLWQKVSGDHDCGSRMPLGRDPIPTEQVDRIAAWIDQGAPE